jgi:hypothetical protein
MSVKNHGTRHGIEEIFSTNHIAREHFSSNLNARTRHRHGDGHGTARPYRNFFTVIRNLHYQSLHWTNRAHFIGFQEDA